MYKLIIYFFFVVSLSFSQVGIGTTNPDSSSKLDIVATDAGILIPRMTVAERIAISNPADALLVYQTDDVTGFYYFYNSQWHRLLDDDKDAGVPTAAIFAFPASSTPPGYLVCDGSAVSRITYADLFAIIGTTYGSGDGSTTFNLPDYRGKFLRGWDNGSGIDPDAASRTDRGDGTTGDNVGTNQSYATQSHFHGVDPPNTYTGYNGNHNHYNSPITVNSSYSGVHNHTVYGMNLNTSSSGNHAHNRGFSYVYLQGGTIPVPYAVASSGTYGPVTSYSGSHNHSLSIPSTNTSSSSSHNHFVSIPGQHTSYTGNHSHALNISPFNSGLFGASTESRPVNINVMYCIKY